MQRGRESPHTKSPLTYSLDELVKKVKSGHLKLDNLYITDADLQRLDQEIKQLERAVKAIERIK